MTVVPEPAIRLKEPTDIINVIPYLLGFQPEESIVVVALRDSSLLCTARIDFADVDDIASMLYPPLIAAGADTFLVVAYGDGRTYVTKMLDRAIQACPLDVEEGLWVANGMYGCIHPEGAEPTPLPATPGRVEAEAVSRGLVKLSSRRALEATFTPLTDDDGLWFMWNTTACQPPCDLTELLRSDVVWSIAVRFAMAVQEIGARDETWFALEELDRHAALLGAAEQLREVARRVPAAKRVPVLFLCGWAYWRDGKGAEAAIALERLGEIDPDYSAARLLGAVVAQPISPNRIPQLTKEALSS